MGFMVLIIIGVFVIIVYSIINPDAQTNVPDSFKHPPDLANTTIGDTFSITEFQITEDTTTTTTTASTTTTTTASGMPPPAPAVPTSEAPTPSASGGYTTGRR